MSYAFECECVDVWAVARVVMEYVCSTVFFFLSFATEAALSRHYFLWAPNTNVLCSLFIWARHTERIKHSLKIYQLDNNDMLQSKKKSTINYITQRLVFFFIGWQLLLFGYFLLSFFHLFIRKVFFSPWRREKRYDGVFGLNGFHTTIPLSLKYRLTEMHIFHSVCVCVCAMCKRHWAIVLVHKSMWIMHVQ